jgi:MinD-like ATPase involved in chromosome partitioning or flagellar assembly
MKIDFYLPEDPKDVHRALNTGIPFVVDRPRTKISRSIHELCTQINGVT